MLFIWALVFSECPVPSLFGIQRQPSQPNSTWHRVHLPEEHTHWHGHISSLSDQQIEGVCVVRQIDIRNDEKSEKSVYEPFTV